MQRDVEALVDGGISGVAGTAAMSALMLGARRIGLLGRQPPERLTEHVLDTLGLERHETTQDVLAAMLHFGFGATMGALFGLVHRRTDARLGATAQGVLFGTAVWAVS